jgi:hypothetical protein
MLSPRHALADSLNATITPEQTAARRASLETTANPLWRVGGLALHDFAIQHPALTARLLGMTYEECELEDIGAGGESSVYRLNPDEVLKVNRLSIPMSSADRKALAGRKTEEQQAMIAHLGDFVIPQTLFIAAHPHPFFSRVEALQARQAYVDAPDVRVFHVGSTAASIIQRLGVIAAESPATPAQILTIAERGRALYREYRLVPDIEGPHNLGVDASSKVRFIDPQPIAPDQPNLQARILRYFDHYEAALEAMGELAVA